MLSSNPHDFPGTRINMSSMQIMFLLQQQTASLFSTSSY
uniref:Uncharacterized protein n=1 Tax=Arundo donax TaxID=35708 RepID=A0A0A9BKJ8_ARUDO